MRRRFPDRPDHINNKVREQYGITASHYSETDALVKVVHIKENESWGHPTPLQAALDFESYNDWQLHTLLSPKAGDITWKAVFTRS